MAQNYYVVKAIGLDSSELLSPEDFKFTPPNFDKKNVKNRINGNS